jgi:hypothetical protein
MKNNKTDDEALREWLCSGTGDMDDGLENRIMDEVRRHAAAGKKDLSKRRKLYDTIIISYCVLTIVMFALMLSGEPLLFYLGEWMSPGDTLFETEQIVKYYYPFLIVAYTLSMLFLAIHFFKTRKFTVDTP